MILDTRDNLPPTFVKQLKQVFVFVSTSIVPVGRTIVDPIIHE